MARDVVEKVAEQTVVFFEKATEVRFLLHFLCIAIYLELGLFLITGKPLHLAVILSKAEYFEVGKAMLVALGYFFLMGYLFRLMYALICFMGQRIHSDKKSLREIPGMVHEGDVRQYAYDTKDNELLRTLETHKESCLRNRKETKELAYLSFAALALVSACLILVPDSFLDLSFQWIAGFAGEELAVLALLFLLLPLLILIWGDTTDDFERDQYLLHKPLYSVLENEKQKAKQVQEELIRSIPPIRI